MDDYLGREAYWTGVVVAALTFLVGWGYAIATWGFFLGVAFGWIPAAIVAVIIGGIACVAWPLVWLGGAGLLYLILGDISR